jgi:hypothetical protein
MVMMLSRTVRRVPLGYEHPVDRRGNPQPRFDRFYVPAVEEWLAARERWVSGEDPDRAEHPDMDYGDWEGDAPDPDYYHRGRGWPEGVEMGIQMYEEVSEGSPISGVYPDTDDGRRAMAEELSRQDTGITSDFTAGDWRGVIDGQVFGTDIKTGEIV